MDQATELLQAIVARLKETSGSPPSSAVTDLVGERIYDRVPTGGSAPVFPYVSLGPHDAVSEDAECIETDRVSLQIDVWSKGDGEAYSRIEAGRIASAIRAALHDWTASLTTNAFVSLEHRVTRFFRDPSDSAINHAAMTFEAFVEGP